VHLSIFLVINQLNAQILIIIIIIIIAIGLLPGGSGYFTCKQNMKMVTTKFKSGGLHVKHVDGNLESWEPSRHLLFGTRKPRKNQCRDGRSQGLPNTDF